MINDVIKSSTGSLPLLIERLKLINHILAKVKNMWSFFSLPLPKQSGAGTTEQPQSETVGFEGGWSWIPNWPDIFNGQYDEWLRKVQSSKNGQKILIATCIGGNSALTPIESLLAVALTLRGASVDILLCDKAIPACANALAIDYSDQNQFLSKGPTRCDWCFESGFRAYKDLGLPVHLLSEYINESDRREASELSQQIAFEEIPHYSENGIAVGEHAIAAALRYFARGDFEDEPMASKIVRRYLEAGIISGRAINRLYEKYGYQTTVVNHGIYVPQGLVIEVAKKHQSSRAIWYPSYRNKCVTVFSTLR